MNNKQKLMKIALAPLTEDDFDDDPNVYLYKLCVKAYNLGLEVAAEQAEVIWVENPKMDNYKHEAAIVNIESILNNKL